jgi:hypothetical protein
LTVNLSPPTVLGDATHELLDDAAAALGGDLDGLLVEITEEALIENELVGAPAAAQAGRVAAPIPAAAAASPGSISSSVPR